MSELRKKIANNLCNSIYAEMQLLIAYEVLSDEEIRETNFLIEKGENRPDIVDMQALYEKLEFFKQLDCMVSIENKQNG